MALSRRNMHRPNTIAISLIISLPNPKRRPAVQKDEIRMTRQQVYDLVWSKPIEEVAEALGVPLGNLSRKCREHNIPFPGISYWWPKKNGAEPKKERLPQAKGGSEEVVLAKAAPSPPRAQETPAVTKVVDTPPVAKAQPIVAEKEPAIEVPQIEVPDYVTFERMEQNSIVVSEELHQPHQFIQDWALPQPKGEYRGNVYICPERIPRLSIMVSEKSVNRALCIMDAILKALTSRGIAVTLTNERYSTRAIIGNERIGFYLAESTSKANWTDPEHPPLVLHIRNSHGHLDKEWRDSRKLRVEDCLNYFVIRMLENAETGRLWRLEQERQHREWEERKRLEREELDKAKRLEADIHNWRKALRIRTFLEAVRQKLEAEHHIVESDSELALWLEWTSAHADKLDPLTSSPLFRIATKPALEA